MTTPEALNALADRVEREEPSRTLDVAIARAVEPDRPRSKYDPNLPRFSVSPDAAVTLVPEGWNWLHSSFDVMTCVQNTDDDKAWAPRVDGTGRTLAAALTSAALRARAADMQARAEDGAPHPSRTA